MKPNKINMNEHLALVQAIGLLSKMRCTVYQEEGCSPTWTTLCHAQSHIFQTTWKAWSQRYWQTK